MLWLMVVTVCICFFLGLAVGSCVKPFRIRGYWYGLALMFGLSLAVLGFHMEPQMGLDLYRLNQIVDRMRLTCDSLADALVPMEGDQYGTLYFFQMLCFFVSRLEQTSWLSFIAIVTTMTLLLWVLINYLRSEDYSTRMILPSIAIIFMGMQIQYVFSGVRNAMAVAFVTTGLYLMFYKRKHYLLAALLCLMAATTHSMVLILVPVVGLCWLPKGQTTLRVIALLSLPIVFAVAEMMLQLPVPLLQSTGIRILYYADRSYLFDRPEMIADIIMFLCISLGYALVRYMGHLPSESRGWQCYMNAYNLLGCIMLGCISHRDFILRLGYLMGVAAVPVLCRMLQRLSYDKNMENRKVVQTVVLVVVFALTGCCVKVFYDTVFVMSQWDFRGF